MAVVAGPGLTTFAVRFAALAEIRSKAIVR